MKDVDLSVADKLRRLSQRRPEAVSGLGKDLGMDSGGAQFRSQASFIKEDGAHLQGRVVSLLLKQRRDHDFGARPQVAGRYVADASASPSRGRAGITLDG